MRKFTKVVLALALLVFIAAPALAATEWNFGGVVRFRTFYEHHDFGKVKGGDLEGGGAVGLKNDGFLDWTTQPNSQLNIWANNDRLSGYFELGYDFSGNSVWTREMWGRYQISDNMDILIGQSFELFNSFISRQVGMVDLNMNGIGTNFRPPRPLIQLHIGPKPGFPTFLYNGFVFALVQPESAGGPFGYGMFEGNKNNPLYSGETVSYDRDTFMPKIEAAYQYMSDTWRIKIAAAYANHRLKNITVSNPGGWLDGAEWGNKTIHSWNVGLDGDITFGPLYLGANVSVGQNWDNAGWNNFGMTIGSPALFYPDSNNPWGKAKIENTTTWMASIVAAYQLTEALRFEAGFGWRQDRNKMFGTNANAFTAYLQAWYDVTPGFSIVPEIGYFDFGKTQGGKAYGYKEKGVKKGDMWYAGIYWMFRF